jgi:N-acetylneuraminate lyase
MKKYPRLSGLIPATHTPFRKDGSLNLEAVEKLAAHLLKNGVRMAFIGGTTGESHSLTVEERRQLAQRWFEVARGTELEVIVHVGANCLEDARTLAVQAQSLGARGVAALAPSYFKPRTVELLVACCVEIAAAAPETPFYFYDIPVMTGLNLPMGDFLTQAADRIPTLSGLKFSNPDLAMYQLCLNACGGRFDVPYGSDEWILGALALGGTSAVGSTYNFAAPLYHRLWAAFEKGDLAAARVEQFRSVQVVALLSSYGFMAAAKALMGFLGVDVGPARLPNGNLRPEQVNELRSKLETMGFFDWIR